MVFTGVLWEEWEEREERGREGGGICKHIM